MVLVKGKAKINSEKTFYECQPGSLCSVGFPAVKSKQQRGFFYCNRETIDVSAAAL